MKPRARYALTENFGRPIMASTLAGKIAAALSHDTDAENIRATITLLDCIQQDMPHEWSGIVYDALHELRRVLHTQIEPVPTLATVREHLRFFKDKRFARCQCGCVVDSCGSRGEPCRQHRPRMMGPLPDSVERDLAYSIRD